MNTKVEQILIVDSNDNVIGSKARTEIRKDNIYRVSSLWVFNRAKKLLVAQRPLWKSNDPGKWTESAVGTNELGETYESNLVKEAMEELGLELDIDTLKFIAKDYYEGAKYRMFGAMYAVVLNELDPKLNLDTHEVPTVEWLSYTEIVAELENENNRFVEGFGRFFHVVWDVVKD